MQGARERETVAPTHDFALDPGGCPPAARTAHVGVRAWLEALAEWAIDCLDILDGEPDLEDDGCAEDCHRTCPREMPARPARGAEPGRPVFTKVPVFTGEMFFPGTDAEEMFAISSVLRPVPPIVALGLRPLDPTAAAAAP